MSNAGDVRTAQDFLSAVLAPKGAYALAVKKPGWKGFRHYVFQDLERMARAAAVTAGQGFDTYFALSSFNAPADPREFKREQTAAFATRALVIDADVKPEDGRFPASKDEAFALVAQLVTDLRLPAPIAVDSGGGVHFYWPMAHAVKADAWRRLGTAFKAATRELSPKLAADPTRMADSAGVLRVPGTQNFKQDAPRPVHIVQWSDERARPADIAALLSRWVEAPRAAAPKKTALLVDLAVEEPSRLFQDVLRGCGWLRGYTKRVALASEPEWYAVLGLAKHLYAERGEQRVTERELAHLLSKGHPGYSPEETDRKFDQVSGKQTGPTMCARFADVRPEGCKDCPLAAKVTTPLHVVNFLANGHAPKPTPQAAAATTPGGAKAPAVNGVAALPPLPFPYFHDAKKGGIWIKQKDADGTLTIDEVTQYNLFLTGRSVPEDGAGEHLIKMLFVSPQDGRYSFSIPSSTFADPKKMAGILNGYSVYTPSKGFERILHYLYRCAQLLQNQQSADSHVARFGWRRDKSDIIESFSFGHEQLLSTGQMATCECSAALEENAWLVEEKGDFEVWKQAFNVYAGMEHSEAFQFAALTAFGAPLLEFTEYRGVLFNMVGSSGAGKSTALQLLSSVWGKPCENHMMKSDTDNAMPNQLGMMNSLPVVFDEITNIPPERLSDFALWLTQGRGKKRATRTGELARQAQRWATIVVSTSNASLHEKLFQFRRGFAGEVMRVFEVHVPPADRANQKVVNHALAQIKRNHGHAGRVYVRGLLGAGLDNVKRVVAAQLEKLALEHKLGPDERFWAAAIAATYVGGTIAKKLGLHSYDMEKVMAWAMDMIGVVRKEVKKAQQGAGKIIADYINETLSTQVVVQDGNVDQIYIAGRRLPRITARLEYEGEKMVFCIIPAGTLMEWARMKRIDTNWLKQVMADEGLLITATTKRIAAGTGINLPGVQCYVLDPEKFVEDPAALKGTVLAEVERAVS